MDTYRILYPITKAQIFFFKYVENYKNWPYCYATNSLRENLITDIIEMVVFWPMMQLKKKKTQFFSKQLHKFWIFKVNDTSE